MATIVKTPAGTWKAAIRKRGLADLHFHDLCHAAISRLVNAGLSAREAAAISGHNSMQMPKRNAVGNAAIIEPDADGRFGTQPSPKVPAA